MKIILLLVLLTSFGNAEILRLSLVAIKAGPGITALDLGEGEAKQIIFVHDKSFITEKDVKFATPSPSQPDSVDITLTPAGTKKMIAVTTKMRPSIDRIAIIVNGKILSAPVVQSVPLGKNFVISGLDEKDEALKLAGALSGKSAEEITKNLDEARERLANLPKPPPPVYYTEEEYRQLAAEREKMGLHYMDRLYTEEELDELLSPGMILAEVTGIFGKAHRVSRQKDGSWEMTFETAPEKFPIKEKYRMNSFIALFRDGKFVSWRSFGWSKQFRQPKPLQSKPKPTHLIIKTPPADISSEDFDIVKFVEAYEISFKPGEKEPTEADVFGLVNVLFSISGDTEVGKTVDSTCDVFAIVAPKIPELAVLAKKSKDRKVLLSALRNALQPYVFGEKPLN